MADLELTGSVFELELVQQGGIIDSTPLVADTWTTLIFPSGSRTVALEFEDSSGNAQTGRVSRSAQDTPDARFATVRSGARQFRLTYEAGKDRRLRNQSNTLFVHASGSGVVRLDVEGW